MRFIGNILWFVFGGWYLALTWLLGAIIFAITIIALPLTRAAIEMAKMSAFPFGKDVVHVRELDGKEISAATATTGTITSLSFIIHRSFLTFSKTGFIRFIDRHASGSFLSMPTIAFSVI